jgi:hypothetical protein
VTLPDGKIIETVAGKSSYDVALQIAKGLADNAVVAKVCKNNGPINYNPTMKGKWSAERFNCPTRRRLYFGITEI